MSTPTYVALTQDYTDEKNFGTVHLTKGEIYKVSDDYDPSDSYARILIDGGKTILVPTNLTIKIINLQPRVCVNVNGGKKKRTRRNKRVKSRRRIKGKSVRRSRK
jgi:hypothetical protein